jgi:hypothetical protein
MAKLTRAAGGWLHAVGAVLGAAKMVYRQASFAPAGCSRRHKTANSGGSVHVGFAPFRHQNP